MTSEKISMRIDATIEGMATTPATTATFCATLVDEWVRLGVAHAVVSPGSRSTPMAIALASNSKIALHVFHDERSASFAALGIGLQSGTPAVLLCTSGTAAAQFFAAVIEANYAHVPLLVCTADRPPELQGVGAPQTINQTNLYGTFVRKFIDVGLADDAKSSKWRTIARDAFSATVGVNRGPCHVNLPFREPLVGVAGSLPVADSHSPVRMSADVATASERKKLSLALRAERGIIIAGNGIDQPRFILELAAKLKWPVVADPRSNCRVAPESSHGAMVSSCADVVLRHQPSAESLKPTVVLRIGDPPVSKVVNQWLAQCGAEQIAVTQQPSLVDPDKVVTTHIVGSFNELFMEMSRGTDSRSETEWIGAWKRCEKNARTALDEELSKQTQLTEPLCAVTVSEAIAAGTNLVVSSSMPVRDLEWFAPPRDGVRVFSNRGVNGIDGVVSTAVGVALSSKSPTALLIGDIAMLHDSNGLLNLIRRDAQLKIIVIDNEGGGIFSFLPQAQAMEGDQFEQLFGTPHSVDFAALAKTHGIAFTWVSTAQELRRELGNPASSMIGVRTDRSKNVDDHNALYSAVAAALSK
jgi:2-succinyl-5-enolpyruvyl-6-hydroxy-3-cyclohexene-1-carboxylate synthase